ncbi:NFAT activation molecule 1 [Enoplosus armatus]|uniref:NFAT activation molecule 1 n=1 Tax=Enoplosus armatus TaxID=215367 RepID=UPI0039938C40
MLPDSEIIIVGIFTGMLLVFSVVGSVCVFRGHWKERIIEGDNRNRKQNREERKERETEEAVITAQSTSFYASLEPRPRSIYDVLDQSAANREPDQSKAKPKKNEPQKTMAQTTQPQHEDVFESVYENF